VNGRIFLTVGSQMPFDRLVAAVNVWARGRTHWTVQAQIGMTALDAAALDALQWEPRLAEAAFREHCRQADFIVAHAGMGAVLTALEFARPMVLMPRRAALRETRNDHQFGTARWLMTQPGIELALDEHEVPRALDRMVQAVTGAAAQRSASSLRPRCEGPLVDYLAGLARGCAYPLTVR